MERRKKNKIPTAILTADWHLREDIPICRKDDFWNSQWGKVDEVRLLQERYGCPVIHSGDLFNHWKPSPYLLSAAIKSLPDQFHTIYGNHDLPQHNLELSNRCGIDVLYNAGCLKVLPKNHWEQQDEPEEDWQPFNRNILVWHVMTYKDKEPYPNCPDSPAKTLLKKNSQYDLIVTGHNHQPFIEECEGRLLVNPGSLTRQSADETHQPCVYLWYEKDNTVEPVHLTYKEDVISREHIEIKEKRDDRISAFVQRLDGDWEVATSFEDNLEHFQKTNHVKNEVMDIIYKAIE
jgi:DNA repair exonuclease SbcCD nuclease subunit